MENDNAIFEIAELYRRNPRRGFDLLYQAMAGRMAAYLKRAFSLNQEEIADVVHDAFLPWVETPEKMAAVRNPGSYLFSSAKFLAIRKKRDIARTVSEEALADAGTPCLSNHVETGHDLQACLLTLPEEQREAVTLKIWGDLSFEEIAEIQEVTLQTAASRYRYALQKLKEKLKWSA